MTSFFLAARCKTVVLIWFGLLLPPRRFWGSSLVENNPYMAPFHILTEPGWSPDGRVAASADQWDQLSSGLELRSHAV